MEFALLWERCVAAKAPRCVMEMKGGPELLSTMEPEAKSKPSFLLADK